jgi:hypothetical protein
MLLTYEILQEWFGDLEHGEERTLDFFGNFEKTQNGCQLWKGPFWESGHGRYTIFRHHVRIHRVRWVWEKKQAIPAGLCVRHFFCDQKPCGNPEHLIPGTNSENGDDDELIHGGSIAFGPGYETGGEPSGEHCYHNIDSMRADPSPRKPDGILYSQPVPEEMAAQAAEKLASQTLEEWLAEAAKGRCRQAPQQPNPFKR